MRRFTGWLLALSALILWPAAAWVRGRRGRPALPVQVQMAQRLGGVVSGLYLLFLAGLGLFLAPFAPGGVYGVPLWVKLLMALPLLAVVLTVPLIWMASVVCRSAGWSSIGKLHLALLTLVFVVFIPCLAYWNLLYFPF